MSEKMKLALKWGLIAGLGNVVYSLIMFLLDVDRGSPIHYLAYIIIIAAIIFGLMEYRSKVMKNSVGFSGLFGTGMLIALFYGIISGVWVIVYMNVIDPGMIEQTLLETEIRMEEQNLTEEQIQQALTMTKKFMQPLPLMIMAVIGSLVWGLVVSSLSALILRDKNYSKENGELDAGLNE